MAFGVSKGAVAKRAKRDGWTERLEKIEADARAIGDKNLTDTIAEVRARHAKTLRVMHARAVTGLREYPITNCMDAMRAAKIVIELERLAAGDNAQSDGEVIASVTRQEIARLLTVEKSPVTGRDEPEAGADDEDDW